MNKKKMRTVVLPLQKHKKYKKVTRSPEMIRAAEQEEKKQERISKAALTSYLSTIEIPIIDVDNEHSLVRQGFATRPENNSIHARRKHAALASDMHKHVAIVKSYENIKKIDMQRNFGFAIGDLVVALQSINPGNITRIYRVIENYTATPEDIVVKCKCGNPLSINSSIKTTYKSCESQRTWSRLGQIGGGFIKLEPVISFSSILPQSIKERYCDPSNTKKMNFKYVPYTTVFEEIVKIDLVDLGLFFKTFQNVIADYLEIKTET